MTAIWKVCKAMADVDLNELRKVYGHSVEAVKGISIHAADGEFVVLVGPSGCGKSTLLRMIAGLETITSGTVSIAGHEVNDLEPADRDIAMVFQTYALYPHMTVWRNMAYGLQNRRMPKDEIDSRVKRAAEILQLSEYLDRRPRELSGGQRQRVAMGRAIVRDPQVFLFDEPLSNLDAKLRVQMRLEIKRLQRELGVTSFYVTHDQVEAMTMADRLVVMNSGIAEQVGTPMEVYNTPASLFVAGFIGSPATNFLPGRVTAEGAQLEEGALLPVARNDLADIAGRPATIGLRPEHLTEANGTAPPSLRMTVDLVEPLGADTLAHGRIAANGAGGSPGAGHDLTVRLPGGRAVAEGDALALSVAPEHVHLFDPETAARL
jgi:sn-glycerol 3-phosphate transport system ATP-binding protein